MTARRMVVALPVLVAAVLLAGEVAGLPGVVGVAFCLVCGWGFCLLLSIAAQDRQGRRLTAEQERMAEGRRVVAERVGR